MPYTVQASRQFEFITWLWLKSTVFLIDGCNVDVYRLYTQTVVQWFWPSNGFVIRSVLCYVAVTNVRCFPYPGKNIRFALERERERKGKGKVNYFSSTFHCSIIHKNCPLENGPLSVPIEKHSFEFPFIFQSVADDLYFYSHIPCLSMCLCVWIIIIIVHNS